MTRLCALPLDSRPCSALFPLEFARWCGCELTMPRPDEMDHFTTPASLGMSRAFIERAAPGSAALCLSVDHWCYGSLLGSRTMDVSQIEALQRLDTLRAVFTEPLNQTGFRDSLKLTARIARVGGVKIVPDRTSITFITDVLSEVHLNGVLIHGINLPDGKILRTFPSRVGVKFVTGVRRFKELRPSDFIVVADYNEIRRRPSAKCHIQLKQVPHGVQTARLDESHVDYLIEEE